MLADQPKPITIAYLYHEADKSTFESLYSQLTGLRRNKLIYELPELHAGAHLHQKRKDQLERAQVIILLISSAFDAEDHFSGPNMQLIIKECAEKGAHIWPIIAKYIYWETSSF